MKKTLQDQYDTLNTNNTELKGQYDDLLTTKNDLDTQIVNLSTEKNKFKNERDEARATRDTYKTERDTAMSTRDTYKIERDAARATRNTYKTERDTYKTERDNYKNEWDTYKNESEKLNKQVKELVLKIKNLSDPFGPYPVSKNDCMSSNVVNIIHSQANNDDKFPKSGNQPSMFSYWSSMPSGCAYYTDPDSPDYNRLVFDTGADTFNNESNVPVPGACDSGWCLPSASYRVCKDSDNKYKILNTPKDKCSKNLFMVVGVNHSNRSDGTYFNYDLDAANESLQNFNGGTIENNNKYTVYNHRTHEIMDVVLWTSTNSKSNYSVGITNKGHGRRTDSVAYFVPGDYLSFVNHVKIHNSGSPIDNMSIDECKAWADARTDKVWRGTWKWNHFGKGCSSHSSDMGVWYNKKNTGLKCGKSNHMCVSKGKGTAVYPKIYVDDIEERETAVMQLRMCH